jgi:sugar transferase (PEP-CTERM/EpsH1 system associated)
MKILIIDEELPYPPNTGKRIRSFNLARRIARFHDVHYLAYGSSNSKSFRIFQKEKLNPIVVQNRIPEKSGILFYIRLAINLFSPYPYIVSSHHSSAFSKIFKAAVDDIHPDLIICEWSPYSIYVKNITSSKKLIVAHNIEHRIWQRYYENEKNIFKKWYIKKQWIKVKKFEQSAAGWVNAATSVSDIERLELLEMNQSLIAETIENGVDLEYFAGNDEESNNSMVFVGSMNWRPNQDAIAYFVNEIFPIIKQEIPDATATFVGQNPPPHISQLNKIEGINIVGQVDDVRPYIRKAAVYVVPLRIGGGTRLKIIEAFAMEKAVVSTSIGAEGLDIAEGENIVIADSPEKFAMEIMKLFGDQKRRQNLGKAGRHLVEEKYGWDKIADKLNRFIVRVVETK